jgi:CheY-like chemotaxis protein
MRSSLVLIIEDENDVRFNLEDYLREEGFPVLSVGSGKQGLQILKSFPILPGVIILDEDMPNMNGIEFRKQQLSLPEFSHIKVIFTAKSLETEKIAQELGMHVLPRPIVYSDLLGLIHSLGIL